MKKLILLIIVACYSLSSFAQGTWNRKADYPGVSNYEAATFTINGEIYTCTGVDVNNAYTNSLWKFNPATNVWTQLADFKGEARFGAFGFNAMNYGFVGLGEGFFVEDGTFADFWKYDPLQNIWSLIANFPGTQRANGISLSINNKGYIGAGQDFSATDPQGFWEYDPAKDRWTRRADYPFVSNVYGVSFTIGNMGYAGASTDGWYFGLKFFQYDPVKDKWTQKADFGGGPVEGAMGFSAGGKGYVGTGAYAECNCALNKIWVYNPTIDCWAPVADFPGTLRAFASGASINGKGYVMLGENIPNSINDVWEYTPDNLTEQKITFPEPDERPIPFNITDFEPGATTTSNLTITYTSSDTSIVKIVNNKTRPAGSGYVSITASQAGNSAFRPALDVTRTFLFVAPKTDAYLSNLTVSKGTISPAFYGANFDYTVATGYADSLISVTPFVEDTTATVKVNGASLARGASSPAIRLKIGTNAIIVNVVAQDSTTTQTYTINVNRSPISANAVLTVIALTPKATLTLGSGPGYRNYTASVPNSVGSVQVAATAQDSTSTININGMQIVSGAKSQPILLNFGLNVINIAVTAQDGITVKNYMVTVTRPALTIATLANLTLSTGTLNPIFTSSAGSYTANVTNATTSIRLSPTVTDASATIKINGTMLASGTASAAIPLAVGTNTITTVVTAQDGTTTQTYTLTVIRASADLSTNALLTSIKITPATGLTVVSGPGYANYTTQVPGSQTTLTVTATHQDVNSTIKINGATVTSGVASPAIPLNVGNNVINITVTAQDGATTKTYIITATRAISTIATLSNLSVSTGILSPVFAAALTDYTTVVPNTTSFIKITPTVTDVNAMVKVNGTIVASGAVSASIPLAVGSNTITAVVTAQDGLTSKTYTITVTRAAAGLSTNALLTSIKINPATGLTTLSGPGYANYTTSVPFTQTSLTVTATHQDANSTIKVNGVTVASGTATPAIPLNVGSNVITTVVTAQDGATTKTYIINAARAAGSSVATLSNLTLSTGTLSPAFATATMSYTAIVPYATSSIKPTATVTDANATIKVNGTTVASGGASGNIALTVGSNTITTVVTAQDGTTTKTYTLTVTRAASGLSTNALLTSLKITPATGLTTVSGPGYANYKTSVPNSETSLTVTATHQDANSTIKINGVAVASGTASPAIPLNVGDNVITTVVTAQDGATTKTYIITATRAATGLAAKYTADNQIPGNGLTVHQGLSPNGDGDNDVLIIDGITNYPDNQLSIINRSGELVYEAKGYDNTLVVFDGHSNKNGKLQSAGTYFYKLRYNDKGVAKEKTGFILLKY